MKFPYLFSFLVTAFDVAHALQVADYNDASGLHATQMRDHFGVPPDLDELQSDALEKRDRRRKCSPWFMHSENVLGSRHDDLQERNFTLEKRTMTEPEGNMVAFFNMELTDPTNPIIWDVRTRDGMEDANTADFTEYGDTAVSYGTRGLCGCTVLAIFSEKGLYVAHYWENIVFSPNEEYLEKYQTADRVFQRLVINGLEKGVGRGAGTTQVSLRNQAARLDDKSIQALLMIPRTTWDDVDDGYRNRWNQIKSKVGEYLPRLAPALDAQGQETNPKWKEYRYDAVDGLNEDVHRLTPTGKILIKYDPEDHGKKRLAIWIEGNVEPFINWTW